MVSYFTTRVKLHSQWGPKLETSVHQAWIRMPGYLLGSRALTWWEPEMVLGVTIASFGFASPLSLPMWGLMWMG
jgi:hypothetical protein